MASALVGFSAATDHMMMKPAASEAMLMASTSSAMASMQTATGSTAPKPNAAGMVATHVVQVGGKAGALVFEPNNVIAAPGDLVQFQFNPKVRLATSPY